MPFRLFERGPTTPGLGDDNDHHGCEVLKSWDDAPSRGFLLVASRTSFPLLLLVTGWRPPSLTCLTFNPLEDHLHPKLRETTMFFWKQSLKTSSPQKFRVKGSVFKQQNLWKTTFDKSFLSITTSPSQGCHLWVISHIAGCHHGGVWISWSSKDSTRKMSPAWMINFSSRKMTSK